MIMLSKVVLLIVATAALGLTPLERGFEDLERCKELEVSGQAMIEALDRAMAAFRQAMESPELEERAGAALLESSYFKGTYSAVPQAEKIKIFARAAELGDSLIKKHPGSGALKYYLAVCWARWGEETGKVAAARQGVADKVKAYAEAAIVLGPPEITARAYRLLGRLHHQAPRIPFILGWPSNQTAIQCLRKANELQPQSIATRYYLAAVLADEGCKDEARQLLAMALADTFNSDTKVEAASFQSDCRKLQEELKK